MKESNLIFKVLIAVLAMGVVIYMAIYFFHGFGPGLVTANAYLHQHDIGTQAQAILIRDEQVLSGSDGYLDLLLAEGERVAQGKPVAMVYHDPSVLSTRQSIRNLEIELQQLEYTLSSSAQGNNAAQVDKQLAQAVVRLRTLSASGDLSSLEDPALELRASVLQRDYTYGGDSQASQLSGLIAEKQNHLAQLNRSLGQVSRTILAPASGVFSGETDGWESILRPDMLDKLTIDQLSSLMSQTASPDPAAAGKVITGSTWYLAALIPGDSPNLREGWTYPVAFSNGYYGQIDMKLERIVLGEGQTMAIFSCRSHLSDTTFLRMQMVDIILQQMEGIRIPRKALRVETVTVEETDEETGDSVTKEVNRYKVYTVIGSQAEEQEVDILYTGDTYYLVQPVNPSASRRLRPGDEIILSPADVYPGMVVR